MGGLGLLALPLVVIALGMLLQATGHWTLWLALQTLGARTEATITQCRKDVNDDDTIYLVMYDYTVPGESYQRQAREEVSPARYRTCQAGATVAVRYLTLSHDLSRIEGNTYQRNMLSVGTCLAGVLTLTLGTLLWVVRNPPVALRTRRYTATLLNGGCATTVVALMGWLIEFVVVDAVGERPGIVGLGAGLLAGMCVALLTWQPWHREHH